MQLHTLHIRSESAFVLVLASFELPAAFCLVSALVPPFSLLDLLLSLRPLSLSLAILATEDCFDIKVRDANRKAVDAVTLEP